MVNALLITKVHYLVDIVGGFVFSVWLYRTALRFVVYIDKAMSLPYVAGKWLSKKCCTKNTQDSAQ